MSNQELIFHCAPTLANVKIGNMFTVKYESVPQLDVYILEKNKMLRGKGVHVRVLHRNSKTALIYVYRKKQLESTLQKKEIQTFLKEFGYKNWDEESCFKVLESHLMGENFPHEIGAFLGYPLEDIRGFIKHRGKNCKFTGCWKVYHNPEESLKRFQQYKKCIKIYLECYARGFDMNRLTVAG